MREAVARAIAEDLGPLGDVTAALVDPAARTVADVVVRADGVLAGTACATEVFAQIDPTLEVTWRGETAPSSPRRPSSARSRARCGSVLTAERTALNFLCHLSGVATADAPFRGGARRGVPRPPRPARRCPASGHWRRPRCAPAAA